MSEAYIGRVFRVAKAMADEVDGTPGWEVNIFVTMPEDDVPYRGDDLLFEIRRRSDWEGWVEDDE